MDLTMSNKRMMSSRKIADLTEKRHDHVMRDIKKLIDDGAIGAPRFGLSSYRSGQNKELPMYLLDFQATMVLVTGYDSVRRAAVISRWQELEKQASDPLAALNDPATMRSLLLNYSEKVLALEEEKKQLEPKAKGLDRLANADGMMCITDAAKHLQVQPRRLFDWMSSNGWIYRRAGGKNWLAYQLRIQQGLLKHKIKILHLDNGEGKVVESVKVTPKGMARMAEIFDGGTK